MTSRCSRPVTGPKLDLPRLACLTVLICVCSTLLGPSLASAARLSRPALQGPGNGGVVASAPTFVWGSVRRAALYDFQIAADRNFGSIIDRGSVRTHNTAVSLTKAIPDGTYYWRVRGVNAKDSPGPWSPVRRIVKAWNATPILLGPDKTTVSWPSQPLVLRWAPVPHAVRYIVTVASDSALATQVVGSTSNPTTTYGTVFSPSTPLGQGTFYWAVTPLDAEGHRGTRSRVASFTSTWPSQTTTSVSNLSIDSGSFSPTFSWAPVPGAAQYQVEVNSAQDFPLGSKWCCTTNTLGTTFTPTQNLANNAYYWRVRAIDVNGNAGVWNYAAPYPNAPAFTKTFDATTPTINHLQVVDTNAHPLANTGASPAATDTPIVTWEPVPGASSYDVQLTPYVSGGGCDWSQAPKHSQFQAQTSSTAWTPLAGASHIGSPAWPNPQTAGTLAAGTTYCFRVQARADDDGQGGQVVTDWTQINGLDQPAFSYTAPPAAGTGAAGLTMPADHYLLPAAGTMAPRTPLFTWQRVPGAQGYYVIVARDSLFTRVADVGYTNVPAYAPAFHNQEPLVDESTAYYWVVLPTANADGTGEFSDFTQDSPQSFNKSSVPPALLSPTDGATVSTQPKFEWSEAENARKYTLQVSDDPTFGTTLDTVTTDETSYTSATTYPADRLLYWRVRANDWAGQGLNWSAVGTFHRTLQVPAPAGTNPTGGELIPVLGWNPVQGATAYEVHVDWVDGSTSNVKVYAPAFTATQWTGVGVWRWQVRADFPAAFGAAASSGYSTAQQFVRTLRPPTGVHGTKTGTRLEIHWNPDAAAKQYQVDISATDGFSSLVNSQRTDNTSWAPDLDLTHSPYNGRLFWRVAAVDSSGNAGTFVTGSFGRPVRTRHKRHG